MCASDYTVSPLGAVSAVIWQLSDAGCDWLWWQGSVGQLPHHLRIQIRCLKTFHVTLNLVWEHTPALLCPSLLSGVLSRLAGCRSVSSICAYLWKDKSVYTHTSSCGQRLTLRRWGLASYDSTVSCERASKSDTPCARQVVFILYSWLDVFI